MSVVKGGLAIAGVPPDIVGNLENLEELHALASGSYMSTGDQTDASTETEVMAGMYSGDDAVFEVTKSRHFNSKDTRDHKYILTKIFKNKEDAEGRNYIYMINKANGNVDKKIELFDKTPNYIVDEIDNRVFLNEKNHLISGIQM